MIPTQDVPIFGTNTLDDNVFFDFHRGAGTAVIGDVSVPIDFDSRYKFPVVFNPAACSARAAAPTTPSPSPSNSRPFVDPDSPPDCDDDFDPDDDHDFCHYVSNYDRHRRLGCAPPEVMRAMGYTPYRGSCPWCPLGKSRHSNMSKRSVPKADSYLDLVYMDIKVSSVPSKDGVTHALGLVDSCTNDSWIFPLAEYTTAACIDALNNWRVNHLRGAKVGELFMDNDPVFTSDEMSQYLQSPEVQIPKSFSAAYCHHQNGVGEALWARCNPLTTIHVHSAPWLGTDYWPWALRYCNQQLRRRPSTANVDNAVPYELSQGRPARTDHLRPWGCVCYVHNESTGSFGVKARKAYLLGLSECHADGVFDVLMADTLTVRSTMNVVFSSNARCSSS